MVVDTVQAERPTTGIKSKVWGRKIEWGGELGGRTNPTLGNVCRACYRHQIGEWKFRGCSDILYIDKFT